MVYLPGRNKKKKAMVSRLAMAHAREVLLILVDLIAHWMAWTGSTT
jgi:hypothetical protein